jgi:hypothetical protein
VEEIKLEILVLTLEWWHCVAVKDPLVHQSQGLSWSSRGALVEKVTGPEGLQSQQVIDFVEGISAKHKSPNEFDNAILLQ